MADRTSTRSAHYDRELRALTPRQREVIALIARGRTNPEIADELGISLDGAKWHVREIFARLGVDTREEAVAAWHEWQRPRARLARWAGMLVPASWPVRFAAITTAGGASVAGAAVLAAAMSDGGSHGPSNASQPEADRTCDVSTLATSSSQQASGGRFEAVFTLTKPQDCYLAGYVRALLPRTAPSYAAETVGPVDAPFVAPAGTTTVTATATWTNWCGLASTPDRLLAWFKPDMPGKDPAGFDLPVEAPVAPSALPLCDDPRQPPKLALAVAVSPLPASQAAALTPTPASVPRTRIDTCDAAALTTDTKQQLVSGRFEAVVTITKPRDCDLTGRIDGMFMVPGVSALRSVPPSADVAAPWGTDTARVTLTWANYCEAPGTPPALLIHAFGLTTAELDTQTRPGCVDPAAPSAFTLSTEVLPPPPPRPVFSQPAGSQATIPAPDAAQCPSSGLSTSSDTSREGGVVGFRLSITKPRACALAPFWAAAEDGALSNAVLVSTVMAGPIPVGTDQAFVSVTWSNWCGASTRPFGSIRVMLAPASGTSTGPVAFPDCDDPTLPSSITFKVVTTPDPPATAAPAAAAPPAVRSSADATAFAQWFAGVVTARDQAAVEAISVPVEVACPPAGEPLPRFGSICLKGPGGDGNPSWAGTTVRAWVMDQGGTTAPADVGEPRYARALSAAGRLLTVGCAEDAPACERFVVAIENTSGPGAYTGWVFEAVDGRALLRGQYPGGRGPGDPASPGAQAAMDGGRETTPWGMATFVQP